MDTNAGYSCVSAPPAPASPPPPSPPPAPLASPPPPPPAFAGPPATMALTGTCNFPLHQIKPLNTRCGFFWRREQ